MSSGIAKPCRTAQWSYSDKAFTCRHFYPSPGTPRIFDESLKEQIKILPGNAVKMEKRCRLYLNRLASVALELRIAAPCWTQGLCNPTCAMDLAGADISGTIQRYFSKILCCFSVTCGLETPWTRDLHALNSPQCGLPPWNSPQIVFETIQPPLNIVARNFTNCFCARGLACFEYSFVLFAC